MNELEESSGIRKIWMSRYKDLKKYRSKTGDCMVPVAFDGVAGLGVWVSNQRQRKRAGALSLDQIRLLDEIGFNWSVKHRSVRRYDWQDVLSRLTKFKKTNGHCYVRASEVDDPQLLYIVTEVRKRRRKNEMTDEQIAALDGIGFVWNPNERQWLDGYNELVTFCKDYDNFDVAELAIRDQKMQSWIARQRQFNIDNAISEDRKAKLDKIGFSWDSSVPLRDKQWREMYDRLKDYYDAHGYCHITPVHDDKRMYWWTVTQRLIRSGKRSGKLTDDRIKLLDAIGFLWDAPQGARGQGASPGGTPKHGTSYNQKWMSRYKELVVFHSRFSHCNVPQQWSENAPLGSWVAYQRRVYRGATDGSLSNDQIDLLNKIGFSWAADSKKHASPGQLKRWMARYEDLKRFYKRFEHSNVPLKWEELPKLGSWVARQRAIRRGSAKGFLPDNLIKLLDEINFEWNTEVGRPVASVNVIRVRYDEVDWLNMYDRLRAFVARFRHSMVPVDYKDDLRLSAWVDGQRQACRAKELTDIQINRLDSLAFNWDPKKSESEWYRLFTGLMIYSESHSGLSGLSTDSAEAKWLHLVRAKRNLTSIQKSLLKLLTPNI